MALTGVNIYETRKYVSKLDQDPQNPTTFELGVLTPDQRAFIENKVSNVQVSTKSGAQEKATANFNVSERNFLVCKFRLQGFENFLHPQTGKPVPFDTVSVSIYGKNFPGVTDEILRLLGAELRLELAEQILVENALTGEEVKN